MGETISRMGLLLQESQKLVGTLVRIRQLLREAERLAAGAADTLDPFVGGQMEMLSSLLDNVCSSVSLKSQNNKGVRRAGETE